MIDKTTLDALDGDRTAALALLAQVARGEFDDDVHHYLQEVATRVLDADGEFDDKRRADRIMAALGLGGRLDTKRELRTLVNQLHGLPGVSTSTIVGHARQRGLIPSNVDDVEASRQVRRLLAK